ncbi:MAG: cytochrome P450 [Acidimicrobiales bacterium]|nr:cytochrome P450 [Acidimicrobiales bacterium]
MSTIDETTTRTDPGPLFTDGATFVDLERWHRAVDELRGQGPFVRFDDDVHGTIWATVDLEVLLEVSRRPGEFANTTVPLLPPKLGADGPDINEVGAQLKMLINQDGPDHLAHRKLVVEWFKNSTLRVLKPAVDELVAESMTRLHEIGGECDFSSEVALPLPLRVIMSMMGVPREDEPVLLKLTQEMFSSEDDELGQGDPFAAMMEVAGYFTELMQDRQANPTDDLSSAIANGVVDGTPLETMTAIGLYVIIATAGHDTTSFAMAGGIDALARFPDQFDRLRSEPDLVQNAAYEVVRLTSPVRHFLRHAQTEAEVAGHAFAPGDRVLLSYPGANRDPGLFDDPHSLDVGRSNASRQVGWGHGAHFCLGSRLAHMEVSAVLDGLRREFTSIESTGPTEWTKSHFVGGAKHVPVRFGS